MSSQVSVCPQIGDRSLSRRGLCPGGVLVLGGLCPGEFCSEGICPGESELGRPLHGKERAVRNLLECIPVSKSYRSKLKFNCYTKQVKLNISQLKNLFTYGSKKGPH